MSAHVKAKNSRSTVWIFICLFLIAWNGRKIYLAILYGKIVSKRSTHIIFLDSEPLWFIFTLSINILIFGGAIAYIFLFLKEKLKN